MKVELKKQLEETCNLGDFIVTDDRIWRVVEDDIEFRLLDVNNNYIQMTCYSTVAEILKTAFASEKYRIIKSENMKLIEL